MHQQENVNRSPHSQGEAINQHILNHMLPPNLKRFTICGNFRLHTQRRYQNFRKSLHDVYAPCVISGIEFQRVAHHLGLTASAAKSRLFRARKKVEYALQPVIQRRAAYEPEKIMLESIDKQALSDDVRRNKVSNTKRYLREPRTK